MTYGHQDCATSVASKLAWQKTGVNGVAGIEIIYNETATFKNRIPEKPLRAAKR